MDKRILEVNKEKFYRKITYAGTCIEWQGYIDDDGYGSFQFRYRGRKYKIRAHRACHLLCGHSLKPSDVLRHTCDNPRCVNPQHLRAGTHTDNVADRVGRGRSASGSKHGRAKLTPAKVRQIRRRYKKGELLTSLADEYGIDRTTVKAVIDRRTWRSVK